MNLRPFTMFALTTEQKARLAEALLAKAAATVDYDAIAKTFATLEDDALTNISNAIAAARDGLVEYVGKGFNSNETDMDWVSRLKVRSWAPVRSAFREAAGAAFASGRGDFRREATGSAELRVSVTPRDAARYMDQKMFWISGVLQDTLTRKAQTILANAIKTGEANESVMKKLRDLFAPYVGQVVDEEVVRPARLETIVRTNITDAYNQGRLTAINDPEMAPFIEGVRYSAVLDERTTEVCEYLHDKVFRQTDPDLDRVAPPNHFNCRSVLVPVIVGEEVPRYAGKREVEKGLGMVKTGFGGNSTELQQLVEEEGR